MFQSESSKSAVIIGDYLCVHCINVTLPPEFAVNISSLLSEPSPERQTKWIWTRPAVVSALLHSLAQSVSSVMCFLSRVVPESRGGHSGFGYEEQGGGSA